MNNSNIITAIMIITIIKIILTIVIILLMMMDDNNNDDDCNTGSTLKDVTEAIGLEGNERTLACACLADRVLVQVMHKRMQLCSMDAVLSPDQGDPPAPYFPCVPASFDPLWCLDVRCPAFRPRPSRGEHTSVVLHFCGPPPLPPPLWCLAACSSVWAPTLPPYF